jgi:hypothetical protein
MNRFLVKLASSGFRTLTKINSRQNCLRNIRQKLIEDINASPEESKTKLIPTFVKKLERINLINKKLMNSLRDS